MIRGKNTTTRLASRQIREEEMKDFSDTSGARVILYLGDIPSKEWEWSRENENVAKSLAKLYREQGNDAWWAVVGSEGKG